MFLIFNTEYNSVTHLEMSFDVLTFYIITYMFEAKFVNFSPINIGFRYFLVIFLTFF